MISVIVPIYNVECYLRQCIDSILCQTYRDLEIVLIDDGSLDKSGEICDEYAKRDNRIIVFHTENHGLSAARNLGLNEAKGDYIGFVDSDDWIEPDMYERLFQSLNETAADICNSGVKREYLKSGIDGKNCSGLFYGPDAIQILILEQIESGVWNKLYKKKCWDNIRFPEGHNYEDIATLYKVFLKINTICCNPKILYHYRMRESSIAHNWDMNNIRDYWTACYDRFLFISELPDFKQNKDIINKMKEQLTNASVMIWKKTSDIPREQRDNDLLCSVSHFVRTNHLLLGKMTWDLRVHLCLFFARYSNCFSLYLFCILKKIFDIIKRLKKRTTPTLPLFP